MSRERECEKVNSFTLKSNRYYGVPVPEGEEDDRTGLNTVRLESDGKVIITEEDENARKREVGEEKKKTVNSESEKNEWRKRYEKVRGEGGALGFNGYQPQKRKDYEMEQPSQGEWTVVNGKKNIRNKVVRFEDLFTIFVDGLAEFFDADWLRMIFKECGVVMDAFIPAKRRTFTHLKFGFVRFKFKDEAEWAIKNLNGARRHGNILKVRMARYGWTRKRDTKQAPYWKPMKAAHMKKDTSSPDNKTSPDDEVKRNEGKSYKEALINAKNMENTSLENVIPSETDHSQSTKMAVEAIASRLADLEVEVARLQHVLISAMSDGKVMKDSGASSSIIKGQQMEEENGGEGGYEVSSGDVISGKKNVMIRLTSLTSNHSATSEIASEIIEDEEISRDGNLSVLEKIGIEEFPTKGRSESDTGVDDGEEVFPTGRLSQDGTEVDGTPTVVEVGGSSAIDEVSGSPVYEVGGGSIRFNAHLLPDERDGSMGKEEDLVGSSRVRDTYVLQGFRNGIGLNCSFCGDWALNSDIGSHLSNKGLLVDSQTPNSLGFQKEVNRVDNDGIGSDQVIGSIIDWTSEDEGAIEEFEFYRKHCENTLPMGSDEDVSQRGSQTNEFDRQKSYSSKRLIKPKKLRKKLKCRLVKEDRECSKNLRSITRMVDCKKDVVVTKNVDTSHIVADSVGEAVDVNIRKRSRGQKKKKKKSKRRNYTIFRWLGVKRGFPFVFSMRILSMM